jgi:hypothetical protein
MQNYNLQSRTKDGVDKPRRMWEDTIKVDMREVHVIMSSLLALMKQRLVAGPLATINT